MEYKKIEDYFDFVQPAILHKAINTLRGIIVGFNADGEVGSSEVDELINWCQVHAYLQNQHPFSEIIPAVEKIVEDGIVTKDEVADLCWLCENFKATGRYYDDITSGIQFLAGIIHGIMADNELTDTEILALRDWVDKNDFLVGTYPYDEINAILLDVLKDRHIDSEERERLLAFFSNFIEFKKSANLHEPDFEALRAKYSVDGICAACPEITFSGCTFCFTGEASRPRAELAAAVESLGGMVRSSVTKKTDYLVVGNSGNPCWTYACYGRKIEEAVELRKAGARVIIVNETDFWDAVEDSLSGIK